MSTQISATDVRTLRDRTNLPMMECKKALTEANGDMEKAVELIRIRFKGVGDKLGGRETGEGRIGVHIEGNVGAIVDMRCETAPTARNEEFGKLAADLAKHVAAKNPATVEEMLAQPLAGNPKLTVTERITEVIGLIRENMKLARFARLTGTLGSYVHHDGTLGVLFAAKGTASDPQVLRDVCMHIAAAVPTPVAARREDVPAELIAKETEIARAKAAATGKPANIVQMIAEGQMKTWYAEHVLVEQPFVRDDSKKVGEVLKAAGLEADKFVRYKVGEATA